MTVTAIVKNPEARTLTVTAEFDAPIERVWQIWADPRQLERWWGPPTYPATVEEHELVPGGRVTYVMTGPEGDRHGGWWRVLEVEPPRHLLVEDGFAREDGSPNDELPVTIQRVSLTSREGGGTVMTLESVFPSLEAMQQLVEMGMEEGLRAALGQIDALLA